MSNKIYYSRGRDKFDITPEQRCAEDEDDFINKILSDTAKAKYQQYFCAPMATGEHPRGQDPKEKYPEKFQGTKPWRLSLLAAKRRFISFDCDSFDSPKTYQVLNSYFQKRYKGLLYTTFNYTVEAPRCRFVLMLDSEVDRNQGKRVSKAIEVEINQALSSLAEQLGDSSWSPTIGWDESVYRAEQQCYLPIKNPLNKEIRKGVPVTDAITYKFDGELVNVAECLECADTLELKAPKKYEPNTDDFTDFDNWLDVDEHTLADLQDALFFPPMVEISKGGRTDWQKVLAALGSLKNTPYEDEAYQLALSWSITGGSTFDEQAFEDTWATSRADLTSYKAVFAKADRLGWVTPQKLRPYLELKKVGLYMTDEGLMLNKEEGTGKNKIIVTKQVSALFSIQGLTRDAYSDNWGKLITFNDRDSIQKQFIVPDEQLHKQGTDILQRLANLGLWINISQSRALLDYFNITTAKERITLADTTGWFNAHAFVLPDRTIGPTDDKIMYRLSGRKKTESSQLSQLGTLEEWQEHIAAKCVNNTRLVFAVCVALSAPLLDVLGVDGGVFSLKGPSSKGKSTAQHTAASVWGSGATTGGYAHSCNTSLVGIEVLATAHNDLPLILDELKAANPKMVGQIAYMLALGQGKVRGTKDVTLRDTLQWRTLVLASSEDAFENYLKAAGEAIAAGQQARFVDIPAIVSDELGVFDDIHSMSSAKAFADSLNTLSTQYYGSAGIHWLEKLTHIERSEVMPKLEAYITQFKAMYRPDNASSQLDRVLERFALCAAAGEYATELGVTGWGNGEAINGVGECFNSYVEERGTVGDLESVNGIRQLCAYLSTHRESRFKQIGVNSSLSTFDGYYVRNQTPEASIGDFIDESTDNTDEVIDAGGVYWVTADAMRDRVLANCNMEMTLAELHKVGALIGVKEAQELNGQFKFEYNPRAYNPIDGKRKRYYRIDETKLEL